MPSTLQTQCAVFLSCHGYCPDPQKASGTQSLPHYSNTVRGWVMREWEKRFTFKVRQTWVPVLALLPTM